jgi:hypothetical protein
VNRTLAVALIAIGAILVVLGVLQHLLILRIHIDHLAVFLLGLGLVTVAAGVFGLMMQGREATPLA